MAADATGLPRCPACEVTLTLLSSMLADGTQTHSGPVIPVAHNRWECPRCRRQYQGTGFGTPEPLFGTLGIERHPVATLWVLRRDEQVARCEAIYLQDVGFEVRIEVGRDALVARLFKHGAAASALAFAHQQRVDFESKGWAIEGPIPCAGS